MWTPDALASEAHAWSGDIWRVVESQARIATMKLVDSLAEQAVLEDVLDGAKPVIPAAAGHLHYLLATPFRYWPYPTGSRFRRALQPEGCYYAAVAVETAIAEQAFYRFLFFLESPDTKRPANAMEHTAFAARAGTDRSIDLTAPPLDRDAALWRHPTEYEACQMLADAARVARVEAIHYRSVRDRAQGINVALLSPAALRSVEPLASQTWHLFVRTDAVQASCEMPRQAIEFRAADWANDRRIRDPAIARDGGRDRD